MFASGPVQIRRSDVYEPGGGIAQVLDRAVNDVTLWVERNYVVTWDTSIRYAAQMSLSP